MATQYKPKLNIFTGQLQLVPTNVVLSFKAAVATQSTLPLTGNAMGDARIANDTGHLWVWSIESSSGLLTDWVDSGDITDIDWNVITSKPSSSVVDIDDAVTKKHTRNADQYLDYGGINQIQVTEIPRVNTAAITKYVNPITGNDNNPGTQVQPYQTIQRASNDFQIYEILNQDFTINLVAGTYDLGSNTIYWGWQRVVGAGQFTIQRLGAGTVLIEGNNPFSFGKMGHNVLLNGVNIRVKQNNAWCLNFSRCLGRIQIYNCKFGDNGNTGTVGIFNDNSIVEVRNCSDIDANKVATGFRCANNGILTICNSLLGDILSNYSLGAIVFKQDELSDNYTVQFSQADYKDSITKKHSQGTDQGLDTGGINEVTVINAKDAVDKKHTQNTDQKLDEGGTDEVEVADIKDAVDNKHIKNEDYQLVKNESGLPFLIDDGTLKADLMVDALVKIDGRDISVDGEKLDDIVNPMLYKGGITLNSDFPTLITVESGWTYTILADVTDDDISKTNTGQSFLSNAEIAWNGSNWTSLGYSAVKSVAGKTGIVTLVAGDVGLGNVDNKSEATIITDVKADIDIASAISLKHASGSDDQSASGIPTDASGVSVQDHIDNTSNPHSVTKTQVGLGNVIDGAKLPSIEIAVFEYSTSIIQGDGKAYIVIPSTLNGMNLNRAQAIVITAGTTNATTVGIYNVTDGQEMLSGDISIASGNTVGTPGTIDITYDDIATNDVLRIDIDSVSTIAPLGLIVILEFSN